MLTVIQSNTCARTFTPRKCCSSFMSTLVLCLKRLQSHIWHPLERQQQAFNLVSAADQSQEGCLLQKIYPKTKITENIMKNTESEYRKYSCFLLPPLFQGAIPAIWVSLMAQRQHCRITSSRCYCKIHPMTFYMVWDRGGEEDFSIFFFYFQKIIIRCIVTLAAAIGLEVKICIYA